MNNCCGIQKTIHSFYCDLEYGHETKDFQLHFEGNLYLKSLTLEQFTELVTTSRVPSISDEQFLETYNTSKYNKNNSWIHRKIVALPMTLFAALGALGGSAGWLALPYLAAKYAYGPIAYLAIFTAIKVVVYGFFKSGILAYESEANLIPSIFGVIRNIPFMVARELLQMLIYINDRFLSHYPALINFWRPLAAQLVLLCNDVKGIKYFHYTELARSYKVMIIEKKHRNRERALEAYCKMKNLGPSESLKLKVLLAGQLEYFRRKELLHVDSQEISKNIKDFSQNLHNANLIEWQKESNYTGKVLDDEVLAVTHLFDPFVDLARKLNYNGDKLTLFTSLADHLRKLTSSTKLQGNQLIAIRQVFIKAIGQQVLIAAIIEAQQKNNNEIYLERWDDQVDLMLYEQKSTVRKQRWEKLINPLLDAFKVAHGDQWDEDLVEQALLTIAFAFFNSLKQNRKPVLLNLLESAPDLQRSEPNKLPYEMKRVNHKILVNLLLQQPKWLLEKKELNKKLKVFLLCNKQMEKTGKAKLPKAIIWSIFARLFSSLYPGLDSKNVGQLVTNLIVSTTDTPQTNTSYNKK